MNPKLRPQNRREIELLCIKRGKTLKLGNIIHFYMWFWLGPQTVKLK